MEKYPKIRRIGDSANNGILESGDEYLTVREKLDGANFRFTYDRDSDRLVFGSRNVEYWNDGEQPIEAAEKVKFSLAPYLNKIPAVSVRESPQNDVDSAFTHAIEYVKENIDMDEVRRLDEVYHGLTYFGEAMHPHTIDYEWDETPSFIGFDAISEYQGTFVADTDTERFFNLLGLETAPEHSLDVLEDGFDCPDSKFYDGPAEGVVLKNDMTGQRAKVRGKKFKEMHQGQSPVDEGGYEPADAKVLANQFATEARIRKQIHKADDRGTEIEMGMMEELWRDVFDDIIEEEYETIFLGNHTINTKDFRSEVASNTADVLQHYLSRPDDSVLNEATA